MDLTQLQSEDRERGIIIIGAGIGKTDHTAMIIAEMAARNIPVLMVEEMGHENIRRRLSGMLEEQDINMILEDLPHHPVYIDPVNLIEALPQMPDVKAVIEPQTPLQSLMRNHNRYKKWGRKR
jgi:hypothetical protein